MTSLLILICALYLGEFLFAWLLDCLNLNSILKNRSEAPERFRDSISGEEYENSVAYSLRKGRFALTTRLGSTLFILLLLLSSFPGALESRLLSFIPDGRLFSIIYILVFSLISSAADLPYQIYSQFVIEEEFGFNKTGLRLFISDGIKQLVLSLVLMLPLLWVLFFFMDSTGPFWWIWASAFTVSFQLIIFLLYPVLIAPLFNKFTPLEEGELKNRLLSLAERCRFGTSGIFVMDGSKRSGHSNAYFTGLGKLKRIVLFDTLIESLSPAELEAVLAHEIGHNKLRHIPKRLLVSVAVLTGAFFLTSLALGWHALFEAFGFSDPSYHGILIILLYFTSPLTFFLSPLGNRRSRKQEYEADAYACDAVENRNDLAGALLRLSRDNLSNLTPHSLYSAFYYSHPALSERLEAIDNHEKALSKS